MIQPQRPQIIIYMAHALCMMDNYGKNSDTLRIFNTYCSSKSKMVTRTRLHVLRYWITCKVTCWAMCHYAHRGTILWTLHWKAVKSQMFIQYSCLDVFNSFLYSVYGGFKGTTWIRNVWKGKLRGPKWHHEDLQLLTLQNVEYRDKYVSYLQR